MHTATPAVDLATAIGTVAAAAVGLIAAAVAVWIAIWTDRKAQRRAQEDREHSDKQLARERDAADRQLAEERQRSRERDQLEAAYAVAVNLDAAKNEQYNFVKVSLEVTNHSPITITQVERKLMGQIDGGVNALYDHRYPTLDALSKWSGPVTAEDSLAGVAASGLYAVVTWTDHWGSRWENRGGVVRQFPAT